MLRTKYHPEKKKKIVITQKAKTFPESRIKVTRQREKFAPSYYQKHQTDDSGVIPKPLFLVLL